MLSLFSTKVITKQYSFLEKYTKFKSNMMRSLTLEQNFFLANLIRSLEFFTWIKTLLDLLYCTKQYKEFVSNFHRLSYAIVTRGPWHDPFEAALNFSSRQMKEEKIHYYLSEESLFYYLNLASSFYLILFKKRPAHCCFKDLLKKPILPSLKQYFFFKL